MDNCQRGFFNGILEISYAFLQEYGMWCYWPVFSKGN